ncbi:unnamed protein product [Cylindrotheca closterium]|uniref:Hydroxyproline O-arabinosyltransferase-like domain-containing protein n=1 Tax=Cylindrotheca closterium TaxID=2856 RepID=A0AAD2CAZ1_9STRA|nr:unnamed protein product [Cylindrotheca closterium]
MRQDLNGNSPKKLSSKTKKATFRLFLTGLLVISIFVLGLGFIVVARHGENEIKNADSNANFMENAALQVHGSSEAKGNLFHFIVSSDCTSYQRWETLTLLHSAERVSQCGKFTWIVSGCLPEGSHELGKGKGGAYSDILTPSFIEEALDRHFPNRKLDNQEKSSYCRVQPQVHFTPDYSDMSVYGGPYADGKKQRLFINRQGKEQHGNFGNKYKFNNKPRGLLHWIHEYLNSTSSNSYQNDVNEAIVLIDPDFLFMAPFQLPQGTLVSQGKPAGARYGLGGQWLDFNRTQICGAESLCTKATSKDVTNYFTTGPPYVVHIQDVLPLASKWAALVPPTFDQYPLLYAEMYAYSMAAAHLDLKHNLVRDLFTGCMVDWPRNKNDEEKQLVYKSAKSYVEWFAASETNKALRSETHQCLDPAIKPPPFLHYCRKYAFPVPFPDTIPGRSHTDIKAPFHFFAKRRVEHTVLECAKGSDEDVFVPFINEENGKSDGDMSWNAIAVCSLTQAINIARRSGCSA